VTTIAKKIPQRIAPAKGSFELNLFLVFVLISCAGFAKTPSFCQAENSWFVRLEVNDMILDSFLV
jgi:hypothetical protein